MEVLCIGELLIDFFTAEAEQSLVEATLFEKQAGGAPANVAATIVSLGGQASFCGKVGVDAFGRFLEQTLIAKGVSTKYLVKDTVPTTMAFVSRMQNGERDFSFVRGAAEQLKREDVKLEGLPTIAHFGSATALLSDPFYHTYMQLMQELKQQGVFISFDPNYRQDLWGNDIELYKKRVWACLQLADFVKMSEEEYDLTPFTPNHQWLAVTMGQQGTRVTDGVENAQIASMKIVAVDTTGAGDAFVGAMLKQIADAQLNGFQQFQLYTKYSNIVGALTCTKVGAIAALPTKEEVQRVIGR